MKTEPEKNPVYPTSTGSADLAKLLQQYGCGPIPFTGTDNAFYERHLVFDNVIELTAAGPRERFEAVARSVRDVLSQRWVQTETTYQRENPKRIYYLSMEFLIGRSLANNATNLLLDPVAKEAIKQKNLDWFELLEQEPDAGLGNGGLGRLAACFLDSLATMQIPAMGYGLRYEYGIFKQSIQDGWQHELPDNWLRRPDPWEVPRPYETVEVKLNCSFEARGGSLRAVVGCPSSLIGVPFDRPVVGYGGKTINTLRLWAAAAHDYFNFQEFSSGDFVGALSETLEAESLTRVLYPDDSTSQGQGLRFVQEYFLVACSLADLVRRFRQSNTDWNSLPDKVAIQLNDTHPTLAVPELMRILLDGAHLGWDQAWDITRRTLAYTNHTLLPEALEKWPVAWFETMLPRHLEIIFEINRRLLDEVRTRFPGDEGKLQRVSLIEEGPSKHVRMANLAIVGSHSTNGVAAIHSRLLRTMTVKDLAEMYPERFSNKTNGVTPRRWLLMSNPALSRTITDAIGDGWMTDLRQLRKLQPLADDKGLRDGFQKAKRAAKSQFADWLKTDLGTNGRPGEYFRLPDKTHPRIQTAAAQRFARGRALQPAAGESAFRHDAADVLLFRQGGARLPARQSHHQVHQQSRRHHRRRPDDARPAQGFVPARVLRFTGGAVDPGDGCLQPDLHRRLRSQRHEQHEVHDERGTDYRHAGRRHHRDGGGGRRGKFLLVRLDGGTGGRQPRLVQAAVALRQRPGDSSRAGADLLGSLQPL